MKLLRIFLVLVLVISCAEKVVERPENLLPKEKMIDIYYDLALLGSVGSVNTSVLSTNGVQTMPYIFKKYSIDSLQLVQSDLYYASIPLEYQGMYEEVESRLDAQKSAQEEAQKKRGDSIKESNKRRTDSLKEITKKTTKPVLLKTEGNNVQ